jgi:hypothetical protein
LGADFIRLPWDPQMPRHGFAHERSQCLLVHHSSSL